MRFCEVRTELSHACTVSQGLISRVQRKSDMQSLLSLLNEGI
jgi:hypothetical protein